MTKKYSTEAVARNKTVSYSKLFNKVLAGRLYLINIKFALFKFASPKMAWIRTTVIMHLVVLLQFFSKIFILKLAF